MDNRIYRTKANDVDEAKGVVTVAVNGIGIKDSQGDISSPGSFKKTLKEHFSRSRWFLNHNTTQLLGVPLEGYEKNDDLVMVGKMNLKKQLALDTFEDYKLYAENGRTLEHSIGVKAIKRDSKDNSIVKEWMLGEYSTLTAWGANPRTFLMDMKSMESGSVKNHIDFMRKALNMRYSGEKLKNLERNISVLEKALTGQSIVACGHCGLAFDYDSVPEENMEQQVLDAVANYTRWIVEDAVHEEMQNLKPDIQHRVMEIIESKKSVDDLMSFVRCPKCYARIYRTNTIVEPEPPEEAEETDVPEAADGTQDKSGEAGFTTSSLRRIVEAISPSS